jgi:hypothetical protein
MFRDSDVNWRRGFFRVWLASSVLWIALVALMAYTSYDPWKLAADRLACFEERATRGLSTAMDCFPDGKVLSDLRIPIGPYVAGYVAWATLPPVALSWCGHGVDFRRLSPKSGLTH